MNTQETKPLYKVLDEKRTQSKWELSQFKEGDYSLCKEEAGDMVCDNLTEANAQYIALAVNNFASVVEALEKLLKSHRQLTADISFDLCDTEIEIMAANVLNNIK
jgi:hypothetical protein